MVKRYTNKKNNQSRKNRRNTVRKQRKQRRRRQNGGLGAAIQTGLVPFGLLALQKYQQKKIEKNRT